MNAKRGDVVLVWYPFSSGAGGKKRPCVEIQNDRDNTRLSNTVIVQITSNLRAAAEPTQLLIDLKSPDGRSTGLLRDSLISCNNLATIEQHLIQRVIGVVTPSILQRIEQSLKLALQLH